MSSNGEYGYPRIPGPFRRWFDIIRVVILFVLGVSLIIYSAVTTGHDIPFLIAGFALCGLVPFDLWLSSRRPPNGPEPRE